MQNTKLQAQNVFLFAFCILCRRRTQKLFVLLEDPINLFLIQAGTLWTQKVFVSSEDQIHFFLILAGPPMTQTLFVSSEDPINLFLIPAGPPIFINLLGPRVLLKFYHWVLLYLLLY